MNFTGTTALILGARDTLTDALTRRLRALGAAVADDGPAHYLFDIALSAGRADARRVVASLERAERHAGGLRHICLVRAREAREPADPRAVHSLVIEDGLRFLAAKHGLPLAVLRADRTSPPFVDLPEAALRAAALRLQGEFELGPDRP